jgi:RND family efflux transporter MFP subunit
MGQEERSLLRRVVATPSIAGSSAERPQPATSPFPLPSPRVDVEIKEHRLTWKPVPAESRNRLSVSLLFGLAAIAAACSTPAAAPAGPPAVPVEVVTLQMRPVEQASEFVGTVKSRRSTTVQPQVEGFVTRILVRSGERVQPGAPLMQVDPSLQQAAVANLESQRVTREAALRFAQQEAARLKTLFEAGASSQSELEQAQAALSTAQAQLEAASAQLRQQRVALGYHLVSSPAAGVVGDIPVRVGDSVTRSTVLTTIDQNAGLEVYVNVPVQEAEHLRVGLPVQLLDDQGRPLTSAQLSFVSPAVDARSQSVLAKATLERPEGLRTEQFVRVRIVWTQSPGLTVPVVAVNRVNGQYFAFVAESAPGGQTVAHQRAVQLGVVVGNDYVVKSGLAAGEKLIVSGVQKIADGVPVAITSPAAAPPRAGGASATTAAGEGR